MKKRIAVLLLVASSWMLMAPSIVNHKAPTAAEPPLICNWLPFLCRRP